MMTAKSFDQNIGILVSGFDPFQGGKDWEDHLSNPSGNIALAIADTELKDTGGTVRGIIKATMFPVRCEDFDKGFGTKEGVAEDFFEPFFSGSNKPDMIITFSYGVHYDASIDHHYHLERFAANYRSGGRDNDNPDKDKSPYIEKKIIGLNANEQNHTYIETTLPLQLLANSVNEIEVPNYKAVINHGGESAFIFGYGNSPYQGKTGYFNWVIYGKPIGNPSASDVDITELFGLNKPANLFPNPFQIFSTPNNVDIQLPLFVRYNLECILVCDSKEVKYYYPSGTPDYIPLPEWGKYKDSDLENSYNSIRIEARSGSGGNYMSNEIFYRVAYLRETYKKQNINIPTGHIHMGFNKADPNGTDSDNREKMLNDIIYMIRKFL